MAHMHVFCNMTSVLEIAAALYKVHGVAVHDLNAVLIALSASDLYSVCAL